MQPRGLPPEDPISTWREGNKVEQAMEACEALNSACEKGEPTQASELLAIAAKMSGGRLPPKALISAREEGMVAKAMEP